MDVFYGEKRQEEITSAALSPVLGALHRKTSHWFTYFQGAGRRESGAASETETFSLEKNLHAVDFEDTTFACLTDLTGRKEFEFARPFIMVVLYGDTSLP